MMSKSFPFCLRCLARPFSPKTGIIFKQGLCHARYCLVVVDVKRTECAAFIRRVLRHPEFDTQAKRMGNVIRASHRRLAMWRLHAEKEVYFDWTD